MSTNLQEFVELLNAEQHVPVDKLREYARHGISPKVRGEVWLYLLNVLVEDKTSEITNLFALSSAYTAIPTTVPSSITTLTLKTALEHHTHRFFNPTYASLISSITAEQSDTSTTATGSAGQAGSTKLKRSQNQTIGQGSQGSQSGRSPNMTAENRNPPPVQTLDEDPMTLRTQYSRFLPPAPTSPPSRQSFLATVEEVIGKFWNAEKNAGRDDEYRRMKSGLDKSEKYWIWLVTPLVCCLTRPAVIFFGFQKLTERMRDFPPIPSRIASFLTLFRLAIPELFSYFEDEQVPYVQVATSWVQTLLAKEMWLDNVLRLWDAYFAAEDMFELHCYVCVAVLATCKETLEELDGSEAKLMLMDLPPMDVDRLLQDAANLKVSFPLPRPVEEYD